MSLRSLFTKINDAIRPVHMKGDEPSMDALIDARAAGRAGNVGGTGMSGPMPTGAWMPSQQDEKEHD
jgi:hypothetical protein